MKVVQINAVFGKGSTGKICTDISSILNKYGVENYVLYSLGNADNPLGIKCGKDYYIIIQALISRLLGNYGFNSNIETHRIIREIKRIKPDIVHLHNIHGHDCNIRLLFNFFKKNDIKIVWTFHDCWAFTGYCTYFNYSNCNKWRIQCNKCIQRAKYSVVFDRSKEIYNRKKKLFNNLNLTIVTPSRWLFELVGQSHLKQYKKVIINNGIDLDVFKPEINNFRHNYNIERKKIVLGVALGWEERKGLDVFVELAQRLDNNEYQIVLVGTDDKVDKILGSNIISIHKTDSQRDLIDIYTAADVFVNPTREENFPTVNIEALACGTPVVTFETGGSPEIIDETCGIVIKCNDIYSLEQGIYEVCNSEKYSAENCVKRAALYNKDELFKKYLKLYEELMDE